MERNVLVDRLKGYACFLVLFGHVIMGIRNAGIYMPEFFFGLEKFIWSFHVALFLFLSGAVYLITGEWKKKKTKLNFILHKLINLGIPYVIFSIVYILINSLVGTTNTQSSATDIFAIWKTPIAQYWFLYALFFLFCIWTVFSGILKNWQTTILIVLAGYLIPLFGINLGSFEATFYSALAFGLGTCISISEISKMSVIKKVAVIFIHIVAGVVLTSLNSIEYPFVKEIMTVLGIWSSILFVSLLQELRIISLFLDFMNRYSFQIYLLHTIFTAGIRIILLRINITQWWIHILAGCAGGLAFSVVSSVIAGKVKILNACFFPAVLRGKQKDVK